VNQPNGYRKITVSLVAINPLLQNSSYLAGKSSFLRFFAPFCGGESSEIFNAFALPVRKAI